MNPIHNKYNRKITNTLSHRYNYPNNLNHSVGWQTILKSKQNSISKNISYIRKSRQLKHAKNNLLYSFQRQKSLLKFKSVQNKEKFQKVNGNNNQSLFYLQNQNYATSDPYQTIIQPNINFNQKPQSLSKRITYLKEFESNPKNHTKQDKEFIAKIKGIFQTTINGSKKQLLLKQDQFSTRHLIDFYSLRKQHTPRKNRCHLNPLKDSQGKRNQLYQASWKNTSKQYSPWKNDGLYGNTPLVRQQSYQINF